MKTAARSKDFSKKNSGDPKQAARNQNNKCKQLPVAGDIMMLEVQQRPGKNELQLTPQFLGREYMIFFNPPTGTELAFGEKYKIRVIEVKSMGKKSSSGKEYVNVKVEIIS